MEMGERIKYLRKENGLTQEELAQRLGLKDSVIAKYENGRIENMKRSTIAKMADILGCTPSYLMGWDEEKNTADFLVNIMDKKCLQSLIEVAVSLPEEQIERLTQYANFIKKEQEG